jgi:hypothetical protein
MVRRYRAPPTAWRDPAGLVEPACRVAGRNPTHVVGASLGHQLEHLALAGGQRGERVVPAPAADEVPDHLRIEHGPTFPHPPDRLDEPLEIGAFYGNGQRANWTRQAESCGTSMLAETPKRRVAGQPVCGALRTIFDGVVDPCAFPCRSQGRVRVLPDVSACAGAAR